MNRRFGQIIRLKPEGADAYIRYHSAVWKDVLDTIKQCHITNYSIYHKDNILFAYFEYAGNDFEGDMDKMAADPETQKWWAVVKPLMEPIETRNANEFWADMEEIFHLD
ncbi:L-rhamnose mutarotase [Microbacter margulisiae]|uniref:L-rhamnose mutarotase n=1 Tax=Microbacter margulisiae TaxID=1350067 RepID=A0A7W5H1V9_9PORP|nr:L-rhamnose mutarotase [Microbacter margulisiae]MBB3187009.1 L-rhamnose mutarotase [Microbacter margulisiae]